MTFFDHSLSKFNPSTDTSTTTHPGICEQVFDLAKEHYLITGAALAAAALAGRAAFTLADTLEFGDQFSQMGAKMAVGDVDAASTALSRAAATRYGQRIGFTTENTAMGLQGFKASFDTASNTERQALVEPWSNLGKMPAWRLARQAKVWTAASRTAPKFEVDFPHSISQSELRYGQWP